MCQFCVEHGEGKRWYLNAANYAYDLESDLRRRDYVVGFIKGFGDTRADAIKWMERLNTVPAPLARAGKSAVSRHMQKHHFGQPVPIEECEQMLRLATSVTIIPCICRMHTPGQSADEVCMLVTTQPIEAHLMEGFKDYADGPGLNDFRSVSVDEGMQLLAKSEAQGLMHSAWTFETPFTAAICNCNLDSGCMAMKLTAGYELKVMWRGESVIRMDEDLCTNCRKCSRICPFDSFDVESGRIVSRAERCWGCGICRTACGSNALSLVDRRSVPEVAALW